MPWCLCFPFLAHLLIPLDYLHLIKGIPIFLRPLVKNLELFLSLPFQAPYPSQQILCDFEIEEPIHFSSLPAVHFLLPLFSTPGASSLTPSKMEMPHLRGPAWPSSSSLSDLISYCSAFPHSSLAHWSPSLCSSQGLCTHESLFHEVFFQTICIPSLSFRSVLNYHLI